MHVIWWKKETELHLNFLTTNRCNLLCKHCVRGEQKEYIDLDLSLYKTILKDAKNIGYHSIGYTGGEPCLNPKFEEILDTTIEQGFIVSMATNGLLFDHYKHYADKYQDKISLYKVSLDGFKQEYKQIRGVDRFSDVIKFIKYFREKNIKILVCCCINKYNYNQLYELTRLCKELDVNMMEFFKMIPCEYNHDLILNDIETQTALEQLNNIRRDYGREMTLYYYITSPSYNIICHDLLNPNLAINMNGELMFCCSIPYQGYPIANVVELGLSQSTIKLKEILKEVSSIPVKKGLKHKCEHCFEYIKMKTGN